MSHKPRKPKKPMPPEIQAAWDKYQSSRDETAKALLVAHYGFLVKQIARPFYHSKPFVLDYEDLIQAGTIGLIQAVERFEYGKDATFETFAQLRIRGSIIDDINSLDWTPRSVRKNIRTVLKAEEKATHEGERASAEAVSVITGLSVDEVNLARNQALRTFVLPVNQESMREIESQLNEQETQRAFYQLGILKNPNGHDTWSSIVHELSDLEKSVLLLRFYYDETMVRTAKILAISPNTVSTVQHAAINKLKEFWKGQQDMLES